MNLRWLMDSFLQFALPMFLVGQATSQAANEVTNQAGSEIIDAPTTEVTRNHLVEAGIVVATLVILLAIAFAYFKIDRATRGFYSGRLQSIAILLGVGVVGICIWQLTLWIG